MSIKHRLLFLFIPLVLLPLLLVTLCSIYIFKQIDPQGSFMHYQWAAVAFIIIITVTAVSLLVHTANSISDPIQKLTRETEEIAKGNLNLSVNTPFHSEELDTLGQSIETMKRSIQKHTEALRSETADMAMGKMAAQVVHDLASPLSSIQTAVYFLKDRKENSEDMNNYINLLEMSSTRLKNTTRDLLNQYKGAQPSKLVFSLNRVLDELVGEYQAQAQYAGVEFEKKYFYKAIPICGERNKIQRMLGNVIKNAVESMESCGTIALTTEVCGGSIEIKISDTGCGMSEEVIKKILRKGISVGKKNGNGIGLQMVRQTLEEYGGVLKIESVPDVGTSFVFTLPIPTEDQLRKAEKEQCWVEEFEVKVSEGEKLYVIDDDTAFLRQWELLLREQGIAPVLMTGFDPSDTVNVIDSQNATVIVDLNLTESPLQGADIVHALKTSGHRNVYLCTSDYWKPHVVNWAKKNGIAVCPKPLPVLRVERIKPKDVPVAGGTGYNVLVVDDDNTITMAWELMKKKLAIQSLVCIPNMEALLTSRLQWNRFDIAFVDKNFQGSRYSGADIIRHLKSAGLCKIVLSTGESDKAVREEKEYDNVDFIIQDKIPTSFKPFFS